MPTSHHQARFTAQHRTERAGLRCRPAHAGRRLGRVGRSRSSDEGRRLRTPGAVSETRPPTPPRALAQPRTERGLLHQTNVKTLVCPSGQTQSAWSAGHRSSTRRLAGRRSSSVAVRRNIQTSTGFLSSQTSSAVIPPCGDGTAAACFLLDPEPHRMSGKGGLKGVNDRFNAPGGWSWIDSARARADTPSVPVPSPRGPGANTLACWRARSLQTCLCRHWLLEGR
jgi:hypothetical protein